MNQSAPPPSRPTPKVPRGTPPSFIVRHGMAIRWVAALLASLSLLLILMALPLRDMLRVAGLWMADLGPWAPLVLGLLVIAGVLLFIPSSLLSFASGAVLGLGWGMLVAWVGSALGAAIAMVMGRELGRARVADLVRRRPMFEAMDRAINRGGWKIVALLRLSPIVPFSVQNYLYGLTGIPLRVCMLTSLFFMLPGKFMVVYFGDMVGDLSRTGIATAEDVPPTSMGMWLLRVVGLLATVGVTVYLTQLAQQALAERTELLVGPESSEDDATGSSPVMRAPRGALSTRHTLLLVAAAALLAGAAVYLQLNPLA